MRDIAAHDETPSFWFHNLAFDLTYLEGALAATGWPVRAAFNENRPVFAEVKPWGLKEKGFRLHDSARLFPGKLEALGKLIGLPKLDAGTDFKPGWSADLDLDRPEAWRYVIRDAEIVAVGVNRAKEMGISGMTLSGSAWRSARQLIGAKRFDELFPQPDMIDETFVRPAYCGGINWSRPGEYVGCLWHLDVKSMYPYIMSRAPLPVGAARMTKEYDENKLGVWAGRLRLRGLKNDRSVPWWWWRRKTDLELEGQRYGDKHRGSDVWHAVTVTTVDLGTLRRHYVIDWEPVAGLEWTEATGILEPYIDHWFERKESAPRESLEREIAKRMMNALSGRFGLRQPEAMKDLTPEGWKSPGPNVGPDNPSRSYLPYVVFVTAWARRVLMDGAEKVVRSGGTLIHMDTDSTIFQLFQDDLPPDLIGNGELGSWELESRPARIWEGGFKRYVEEFEDGALKARCAGVPDAMKVELLDRPARIMETGTVLGQERYAPTGRLKGSGPYDTRKLLPKRVPGGKILVPGTYRLDDSMGLVMR